MHHGIGHMGGGRGPVLGGGGVGGQPPPPPAMVKDQPPSPGQVQRLTTSPCPGSKVNHLPLPPSQDTHGYYGQWPGGTHPTGMHSFSYMFFSEFAEFSDNSICHYSKRAWTFHLLCKRPGCYHGKTHVGDWILKLNPNHASVIIRFPDFAEFSEISAPFGKNSDVALEIDKSKLWREEKC